MKKPAAISSFIFLALVVFAAGRYSNSAGTGAHAGIKRILYYVDPMHPTYHSTKPGIAPDCGMELVPVYEGDDLADKVQLAAGAISVSPEKQRLIDVRVETVEKNSGFRIIRTTGRVEAQENRVYRLTSATEGWITALTNKPRGTVVKKDELLVSFYSLEFRNAQQAYLGALASMEKVKAGGAADDSNSIIRINEAQLHALGMGDPQIKELAKKRQTTRDISVVSPIDGIVLASDISPAQWFAKGTEFYRIADLSRVWITADLFNDQAGVLRPGAMVKVHIRELSKTLYARVTENPPLFDAASRTLKLRLEAENPGWTLRPDMFVDLELRSEAPRGVSVPADAVLDSGAKKIVYVQTAGDIFEVRQVEIGPAYGSRVTITRGLKAGEKIVTSGNFLLDSESRIRNGALHSTQAGRDLDSRPVASEHPDSHRSNEE